MSPVGIVRHAVAGRVRLRIVPSDPSTLQQVRDAVAAWPRAHEVRANPNTGSILVRHGGDLSDFEAWAASSGAFELRPGRGGDPLVLESTADALEGFDRFVRRRTGGAFDLRTAVFGGLMGVVVIQALRGQLFGPAASTFGLGLSILSLSRRRIGLDGSAGAESEGEAGGDAGVDAGSDGSGE